MGCVSSAMRDSAFYEAAKDGHVDTINKLARMIKNMDMKMWMLEWEDDDGKTPIMMSLERGHEEATLALLQLGIDVNYLNREQGSVLLAAMKAENFALVNILLERGACPFLKTAKGMSAWDYALVNSRNAPLLREFERYGYASGLIRFQVPMTNHTVDGTQYATHAWQRLWACVVPEYSLHRQGHIFVRRMLYVFHHSKSFTPMCVAELDGAIATIIKRDDEGMTATLDLPVLPYELKGIASVVTQNNARLFIKEFYQDTKFLITFLNACYGMSSAELDLFSLDILTDSWTRNIERASAPSHKSSALSSKSLPSMQ